MGSASSSLHDPETRNGPSGSWRDEDAEPMRVGSLERGQPIFLLAETLERRCTVRLGVPYGEAQERRRGIGRAAAGRGNTLEG
jgi:hypothetical protein